MFMENALEGKIALYIQALDLFVSVRARSGEALQLKERVTSKFSQTDRGGKPMRCHRCKGIMNYEVFYGPHEHFWGWRCICCGEIIDPIILENRNPIVAGPLRG